MMCCRRNWPCRIFLFLLVTVIIYFQMINHLILIHGVFQFCWMVSNRETKYHIIVYGYVLASLLWSFASFYTPAKNLHPFGRVDNYYDSIKPFCCFSISKDGACFSDLVISGYLSSAANACRVYNVISLSTQKLVIYYKHIITRIILETTSQRICNWSCA